MKARAVVSFLGIVTLALMVTPQAGEAAGAPLSGATSLTGGALGACAGLSTGHAKCWGYNADGELGNGAAGNADLAFFVQGVTNAVALTAGVRNDFENSDHGGNCARLSTGQVKCWGYGADGELGNGTTANSDVPVVVKNIADASMVSGGYGGFCAVRATGSVGCWGSNTSGQLGNGTTTNSDVPVAVNGITNATAVAGGDGSYCALLSTGTVSCWGYNAQGELGNGTTTGSDVPVSVSGLAGATSIVAGMGNNGDGNYCALRKTERISCWGYDAYGDLGDGTTANSDAAAYVRGIFNATAVFAGYRGFCTLRTTGGLSCWGYNAYGQLGNGTTTSSDVPVPVTGITTAKSLVVGYFSVCAVLSTGKVSCWGYNGQGELGNGTTTTSDVPVSVSGLSGATTIVDGYASDDDGHYCVLLSTGRVKCWGYNGFGELGNGTTIGSDIPVTVLQ